MHHPDTKSRRGNAKACAGFNALRPKAIPCKFVWPATEVESLVHPEGGHLGHIQSH